MPVQKIWDGSQWVEIGGVSGVSAHNVLEGAVHPDTVAQAATRGSIIVGNATPKWDELTIGAAARYLRSDGTDLAYAQIPASEVVNTPAGGIAATDVQAALNELDSEKAGIADAETITGYPWTFGNVRIDANTGFIEFWDATDWGVHLYGTPTDILGLDSHFRLPQGKEFRIHVGGDTVCGWGRDASGNLYLKDTPAGTKTLDQLRTSRESHTISSGEITLTADAQLYLVTLDTEDADPADDLTDINGGATGCIVVLKTTSGTRDVTVKDGVGALRLAGDFVIDTSTDTIILIRMSSTVWLELSRSNNA